MKRNLSVILLIIVIIISMVIGGCGQKEKNDGENASNHTDVETQDPGNNDNEEKQDEETKEEENLNGEIPKIILEEHKDSLIIKKEDGFVVYESIEVEEETPFVKIKKNGEKVYLSEMSPDVIMIMEAIVEYGKAIFDIDWETATGREEYHLLTPEAQKSFEENKVQEVALEFYRKYKTKIRFIGIEKYNLIEFHVNQNGIVDEAIVDVDYAFEYENVENLANYVAGKTYYAPERLRFKLVGDKWLVDELIESRQRYSKEE